MKIVKLTVFLFVIGLLSGLSMSYVNKITAPRIEQMKIEAEKRANQAIFEGYETFNVVAEEVDNNILKITEVLDNNGERVGLIYLVKSKGFEAPIEMLVGFNIETNEIQGFDVLSMRETPGFGAKITEPEFKEQFKDVSLDNIEFDYITGATITSTAVQAGLDYARDHFKDNF